jgi:hypothetical protein
MGGEILMYKPMKSMQQPWPIAVQRRDRRRPRVSARNNRNIEQLMHLTMP